MRTFQIWCEGYQATGERGTAWFVGEGVGETLHEAIMELDDRKPINSLNPEGTSIWGCRLFDNEADARKLFG